MLKFLHDHIEAGVVLILTPFASCVPHSMALGSLSRLAGLNFQIGKSNSCGQTLQSTYLNRLGTASLTSAVCVMAPCFTWLSQI